MKKTLKKSPKKKLSKKLATKKTPPTPKTTSKVVAKAISKGGAKPGAGLVSKIKPGVKSKGAINSTPRSSERIGVLGGAFNPIHIGHLNSALTVREKLKLDKVLLVPALNPPHKEVTGPDPETRAELVAAAIAPYRPELELDLQEIKRGGKSYSVDTLEALGKTYEPKNIFFIMGADAFQGFATWRNFESLLKLSNFVVTTRIGSSIALQDDIPQEIRPFIKKTAKDKLTLKSGREIIFVQLEDIDVSATSIRKKVKSGHQIKNLTPKSVEDLILEKGLYKRTLPLVSDYREFSKYCGLKALDKKCLDLKIYDIGPKSSYADYTVVCSATSSRHASSVAHGILDSVIEEFGLKPLSLEGINEGQWVLLDYGAVVVHIFQDTVRQKYRLENLWSRCRQIQGELKTPVRLSAETPDYTAEPSGSRP